VIRAGRLVLLSLVFAACAATTGGTASPASPTPIPSPSSTAPTAPPATGEPASPAPLGPSDVATLLANQLAADGQLASVRAGYWSNGADQFLADAFLESYPPQIPAERLRLEGEMPAEVLAGLESTAGRPGFAFVAWGWVEVTGIFHAERGPVAPSLEIRAAALTP